MIKNKQLKVRVSEQEKETIKRKALIHGLNISEYVLMLVNNDNLIP